MKLEQGETNRTGFIQRVLEYTDSHRCCGQAEGEVKVESFPLVT